MQTPNIHQWYLLIESSSIDQVPDLLVSRWAAQLPFLFMTMPVYLDSWLERKHLGTSLTGQ